MELDKTLEIVSKHTDDRVSRYVIQQETMSPSSFIRTTKKFWIWASILNLIAWVFIVLAFMDTLVKNASAPLNLVRIDGVIIEESYDVRRSVLLKNTLERRRLMREGTKGGVE
jgi:hypothetical protein